MFFIYLRREPKRIIPGVLNGPSNDRFITTNGPFFNGPLNDRYVIKELTTENGR